jgi:hypothetical protein
MENPMLYIPSAISHSCFTNNDGEVVSLKEREIDYFYFLLYLYRDQLLSQTPNLLVKSGDRLLLNDKKEFTSVEIELNQFHEFGVVKNHKYNGLKTFIDTVSGLTINTNVLRKNKARNIEEIKIIESHNWESTKLTIGFTKEFVKELIGVEKFFIEVDLTYLLNLSGGKTKLLYLLLKDYSNSGNKKLTQEELTLLIGKIPQTKRLDSVFEQINKITDITVEWVVRGVNIKDYHFTIHKKKKAQSQPKTKKKQKQTKEINTELWGKANQKLEQAKEKAKAKGKKIGDEDAYRETIYQNELKKVTLSDTQIALDEWISDKKQTLEFDCENRHRNEFPYMMISNGKNHELILYDDYTLNCAGDIITQNAEETLNELKKLIKKGYKFGVTFIWNYSKNMSKICLLSKNELIRRGCIAPF